MDRQTIYAGQIPLETDQLKQSQNAMVGLAKLASAVLGSTTIVNAFTVTPTVPASLNVIVTPGEIYQLENLEASAWSSLSPDTHTILKQGIILDPVTLGITPPTTVGYSQVFLIEVQYADVDSGSTVLPYFNANVPTVPFSGPGNAGSAQNTVRKGVASVQIKAGIAAPSGTQVAPTADAGWTGIYLVTVANGAGTVTSGNITPMPFAPFIPVTLPEVPAGVQSGQWLYGVDTGGVNALVANVSPVPTVLTPGMTVHIRAANGNTGATTLNLNGLGASAIHRANGSALSAGDINAGMVVELIWDGSSWQIANYFGFTSSTVNNNTYTLSIPYAADSSGVANSIVAAPNPAITTLAAGQELMVKLANTNTSTAVTITVNSNSAVNVVLPNGSLPGAGQLPAGAVLFLIYDGAHFQVVSWTAEVSTAETQHVFLTSNPSFVIPPNVTLLKRIRCWGGGGGGGGCSSSGSSSAGCGAGYAESVSIPVTPGQSLPITVGAGGAGGSSGGGNGGLGGTSSVGSILSATGGQFGYGAPGSGTVVSFGGAQGTGIGGQLNVVGFQGTGGQSIGGGGGGGAFGTSSAPGLGVGDTPIVGCFPGGGGDGIYGGGGGNFPGAPGGNGLVILEY